ncbi:MAG: type II toxin-antitoxin system VapC family toxin [Verrucomicrobia bacterium]|nr:MAG: type II toxin-antitoxin system VapC family toxin [Verrucomicrobiota bacterium]
MILFDTHVLYWWPGDPLRLSATARDWTDQPASDSRTVLISTVSLWELESKRRAGKITLATSLREAWPNLKLLPGVEWISPAAEDWFTAAELCWNHRDPADRLIAAMALNRGVPVLTKDGKFHEPDSPVKAVW